MFWTIVGALLFIAFLPIIAFIAFWVLVLILWIPYSLVKEIGKAWKEEYGKK